MLRIAWPLILLFAVGLNLPAIAQQVTGKALSRTFDVQEGDSSQAMKPYVYVLLLSGEKAYDYSDAELERLHKGHLAHLAKMENEGVLMMAGPLGEGGSHRGVLILDCASIEEAKTYVERDPAVKAGRLRGEYYTSRSEMGTQEK
jgi:uncharacterized protein YciI